MHKGWRIYYLRNNAISSVRRLYGDSTLYSIIESIMHIDIYYYKIKIKIKIKLLFYIRLFYVIVAALRPALQPPYFDVIHYHTVSVKSE